MLTSNIEKRIRLALASMFTQELQVAVGNDRLTVRTIKLWPLQDDPTLVAPYLVYGPHPQLGRVPITQEAEIGGPTHFWTYFRAVCGTPQATSREQSYDDIEELATRVELTLQKHFALDNILSSGELMSEGGNETVTGNNPEDMLLGTAHRIYGGDAQFYGEAKLVWRYRVERVRNWS